MGLIRRLASDERMKAVWQELGKKSRSSGAFSYAARDDAPESNHYPEGYEDRASWLNALSLKSVFMTAARLGKAALGDVTSTEGRTRAVERLREHFIRVVKDLGDTYSGRPAPAAYGAVERKGLKVITLLEELAKTPPPINQQSASAIVFCVGMSEEMKRLYGMSCHGLVARLATVVFDRKIIEDQIKDWLDGYWGGGLDPSKGAP